VKGYFEMVHLDTNFVIMSLLAGTPQDAQLRSWLAAGEPLRVDAVVWTEFLCGPLTTEQRRSAEALFPQIEPFLPADAARAAELFNLAGRRRGSLTDCMIAAVCLRQQARLATANVSDFQPFAHVGLQIITVR
jgi:predicted nucleic acid-binding protein